MGLWNSPAVMRIRADCGHSLRKLARSGRKDLIQVIYHVDRYTLFQRRQRDQIAVFPQLSPRESGGGGGGGGVGGGGADDHARGDEPEDEMHGNEPEGGLQAQLGAHAGRQQDTIWAWHAFEFLHTKRWRVGWRPETA